MSYFANAGQILIQFLFGALTALVLLRVLLQMVHANFYNPVCQFLYKATNPVLMPLRRLIPAWRNLDVSAVLLAYALQILKAFLLSALVGVRMSISGLSVYGLAELLDFILLMYFWIIIFRIILSCTNADRSQPAVPLAYQITEPLLAPIRKLLPNVAGFDFSPLIASLVIYIARALLVHPLVDLAVYVA